MLTQEELTSLIIKAQDGDNNAKTAILEGNSPLIKSIVRRYGNKGVEYDDLYQLGCIGLLKAISNFSFDYSVRFSTYAVPMIAGEIKRHLRDDGFIKVSRSTKTLAYKISFYIEKYNLSKGKSPTVEEIAKEFSVEPQEVVFAMDSALKPVSIFAQDDDEQGLSLAERLTDGDKTEEILDRITIKDALKSLNDRERKIIVLRYFNDKTQSEVAKVMGVSQVQISRLETKIIKKIRAFFE